MMDVLSKEELIRNRLSALNMEAQNIRVDLQEPELWSKFYEKTNEMIVTKNGRRMFPVIKASLGGLEPNVFYKVKLEFKQIEKNRWKYINGDWLAGKILLIFVKSISFFFHFTIFREIKRQFFCAQPISQIFREFKQQFFLCTQFHEFSAISKLIFVHKFSVKPFYYFLSLPISRIFYAFLDFF